MFISIFIIITDRKSYSYIINYITMFGSMINNQAVSEIIMTTPRRSVESQREERFCLGLYIAKYGVLHG